MKDSVKPGRTDVRHLTIDADRAGQRLDNFLIGQLKGLPRSRIYRILRTGEVRVNGGRTQPSRRLEAGDVVRVPPLREGHERLTEVSTDKFAWLAERIIYEDEDLLAIDKPAGFAVHAGSGVALGLIEVMRGLRPAAPMLELAHRLDRATSGCLLLVKRRPALLALHAQLRAGGIEKRYLALIQGVWRGRARLVEFALERNRPRTGDSMVEVTETGRHAVSRFTPRQRFAHATLMEIELLTGRTHQARVHAAHIGHPIAGDDKYGDRDFNRALRAFGLKRLFLHAAELRFTHPTGGSTIAIEAPLAPELSAALDRLSHGS